MENNKHEAITKKESGALVKRTDVMEKIVIPVADIFETAEAFVVKLDLPGVKKDDISLNIEPDRLTVNAAIEPHHKEGTKLLYSEIGRKRYLREFRLGKGIDHGKIVAQIENAVLTITLPKTDSVKAREIIIH